MIGAVGNHACALIIGRGAYSVVVRASDTVCGVKLCVDPHINCINRSDVLRDGIANLTRAGEKRELQRFAAGVAVRSLGCDSKIVISRVPPSRELRRGSIGFEVIGENNGRIAPDVFVGGIAGGYSTFAV